MIKNITKWLNHFLYYPTLKIISQVSLALILASLTLAILLWGLGVRPAPVQAGGNSPSGSIEEGSVVNMPALRGLNDTIELPQNQFGQPGQTLTYTHVLTNNGPPDSFTLTVTTDPPDWQVEITPTTIISLTQNEGRIFTVTVQIPLTVTSAYSGTEHETIITATTFTAPTGPQYGFSDISTVVLKFEASLTANEPIIQRTELAGQEITYTHTLTNNSNYTDTFTIGTSSSQGWTVSPVPSPTIKLDPGLTGTITITLAVPPGTGGKTDDTTLTVISTLSPTFSASVTNTTFVSQTFALTFTSNSTRSATGGEVIHTHAITNAGNGTDTFIFTHTSQFNWGFTGPISITLAAQTGDIVTFTVQIPPNGGGITHATRITATSQGAAAQGDPTKFAVVTDTTIVTPTYDVLIEPDGFGSGIPGTVVSYTHLLTNTGNITNSFDLDFASSQDFSLAIEPTSPITDLVGGGRITVTVFITIPLTGQTSYSGTLDTTVITATSQKGPSAKSIVTDTTTVALKFAPILTANAPITQTTVPGREITYTHTLTNNSNYTDTFTIGTSSSQGWTVSPVPSPTIKLDPGLTGTITITLAVPPGTGGKTDDTTLTVISTLSPTFSASVTNTTFVSQTFALTFTSNSTRSATGGEVIHTHAITNAGNGTDTFIFTHTSQFNWGFTGPISITLAAQTGDIVTFTVQIPPNGGGITHATRITATSQGAAAQGDPTKFAVVTDTTIVTPTYDVLIEPDGFGSGIPGTVVSYTHLLTNTGNITNSFDLDFASSQDFSLAIEPTSPITDLVGGGRITVTVFITIPLTGQTSYSGTLDTTVITATSQKGPSAKSIVTDTTTVALKFAPILTANAPITQTTVPGREITYTHTLTNNSNYTDTFTIGASSSQDWRVISEPSPTITLRPGQARTILISLTVPITAGGKTDLITLIATSELNQPFLASSANTTTVSQTFGLTFGPPNLTRSATGGRVVYTHTITNTGDGTDTFIFTYASHPDWIVSGPTSILLDAQKGGIVIFTVQIPADGGGITHTTRITATSQGAVSQGDPTQFPVVTDTTLVTPSPGVLIEPGQPKSGAQGEAVSYTHLLTNTGNISDTFALTIATSRGWEASVSLDNTGEMAGGQRIQVTVVVTIPASSSGDVTNVTTITVKSTSNLAVQDTAIDTTTVLLARGVIIAPGQNLSGKPGQVVIYTHTLTNTGNKTDSFTLITTPGLGWDTSVRPKNTGIMNAGQEIQVTVAITIPLSGADSYSGTVDSTTITAISDADSGVSHSVIDVTTVGPAPQPALEPGKQGITDPGTIITYTHRITNTGNTTDTFTITAGSSRGWPVNVIPTETLPLSPNQTGTIIVSLDVPINTGGEIDTTTITATSSVDPSVFATAADTTRVTQIHILTFTLDNSSAVVSSSTTITFTYTITNDGNGTEALTITVNSLPNWLQSAPTHISVEPAGDSQTIVITLIVPTGSGGLTNVTAVTITSVNSPTVQRSAISTVTVPLARALRFGPNYDRLGSADTQITYLHTLTNAGNSLDRFDLVFETNQPTWPLTVDPSSFTLQAAQSATITVTITVPADTPDGTLHIITLTTTSALSAAATESVVDRTIIRVYYLYLPIIMKDFTPPPPPTPTPKPTSTPTGPGVDLVVTDVVVEPNPPDSGKTALVYVMVKNRGQITVTHGNNFFIDFYIDPATRPGRLDTGNVWWSVQGNTFKIGITQTFTTTIAFSAGVHQLYAQIDTQNEVVESIEDNNVFGPFLIKVTALTIREAPLMPPSVEESNKPRPTATPRP